MSVESWLLAAPMSADQIKARLIEREGSIEAVASRIREPRTQVSATINYLRINLRIRKKLIATYGVKFSPYIQLRSAKSAKPKQPRRPPSEVQ